jgi:hypothetical protein
MATLKRAHLLMFTGGGVFGGGAVAMITQAPWWATGGLFALGITLQALGLYTHWQLQYRRPSQPPPAKDE